MRVLVIPSWFPSATDPVAGVFVVDQIRAISNLQGVSITVLTWGHGDSYVPLHKPFLALRSILLYFGRLTTGAFQASPLELVDVDFLNAPALTVSSRVSKNWFASVMRAADKALAQSIAKGQAFDVIHAHCSIPAGVIARKLAKKYSLPFVVTEHSYPDRISNLSSSRKEFDNVFKEASRVLAVSNSLASEMVNFGVSDITVLPNVFDDRVFKYQAAPIRENGTLKLLAVANATPIKGFDVLLKAIADYRLRCAGDVACIIAGGGPSQRELQTLSRRLGLCDVVQFEGALSRDQLLIRYRQCSAVVISSHRETFSMVGLEAIACGRLVVSTRCGGPEDYIIDNENGLLVNINSPQELSAAFIKLRSLLTSYSAKKISKDIYKKYSSGCFSEALAKIYDDVVIGK